MLKNVTNSYELYSILEQKYGSRFVCDPFRAMAGSIQGSIDKKKISITFKPNEYLLISTASTSREVLDELLPILKGAMGNAESICSYDLQSEGIEEQDSMPTIEWDVKDPEGRLKEIINGRAFSNDAKIHNLKLSSSRKIEDYLESEQEKEERIKNARIYGIDPGSIKDVEEVNNLNEVDLFFRIDAMGAHLWRCRHDMAHGRIPEIDLTEEEYAMEYMVYQTTKFGVELPEPTIDKHITATPSYNAWYEFYSNHFRKVLTDEQWKTLQKARKAGEDISAFMPSGSWTDLLEETDKKEYKNCPPKQTES